MTINEYLRHLYIWLVTIPRFGLLEHLWVGGVYDQERVCMVCKRRESASVLDAAEAEKYEYDDTEGEP